MSGPRVVLGVSGGIAAYKAVEVLRALTEAGDDVQVVATEAALRFVGEATWAGLSGHPVGTGVWTGAEDVPHVRLGREAALVLVVPATADLLARAATGRADDLLTATLLTTRAPVAFAPAMHTEMWEHPATIANVQLLRSRGAVVLDPASGRLTGADSGPGRLPDPVEICALAGVLRERPLRRDLAGRRVVVSAGGTREYLDPVRFLGNASSGRQGFALARAAAVRGAEVTLVSTAGALGAGGVTVVRAGSAASLAEAVLAAAAGADAVVMAAAVADFRPASYAPEKIKKSVDDLPRSIPLVPTQDVLAALGQDRGASRPAVVVGFAAETAAAAAAEGYGAAKLAAKGADLMVVNQVGEGRGFEVADNAAVLLGADGFRAEVGPTSKDLLAHAVWDRVVDLLARAG